MSTSLRRIQVPSAITLVDRVSGQRGQMIGFFNWACLQWFNDQRWHANMARFIVIVTRCEAAANDHRELTLDLTDEDWRLLCEVVKQPTPAQTNPLQPPLVALQMEPYKAAVLDAKTVDG